MAKEEEAERIMVSLRAQNVLSHPHLWLYDSERDLYIGPAGEVAGQAVEEANRRELNRR